MTKEEFKKRWELNDNGGNTNEHIIKCAINWGLLRYEDIGSIKSMADLADRVVHASGVSEVDKWKIAIVQLDSILEKMDALKKQMEGEK